MPPRPSPSPRSSGHSTGTCEADCVMREGKCIAQFLFGMNAMTLLKRRSLKFWLLVAAVLLLSLAGSLFLAGSIVYKPHCLCNGERVGGICHTDERVYDIAGQAPSLTCHLRGVHSEKWLCIGSWESAAIYTGVGTSNSVTCHGLEIDLGQCYGIPYSASSDDEGGPIPCNYPCDDKQLLEACKTQDVIRFDRVTVSCVELGKWCHRE